MTLLDCYLPVFKKMLMIIREPTRFDDYEDSRQICTELLERTIQKANEQEVCQEEKEAAKVAVIAWLDETVLCSSLTWRQRWQSELLQRKYLDITVAGTHFFTLLSQLMISHLQAREVFLFCLQQGFHGQYLAPEDQLALQKVMIEQRQLCLPEAWQTWPNEATLIPPTPRPTGMKTKRLRPLLCMTASVILLYTVLFLFLYHYVF